MNFHTIKLQAQNFFIHQIQIYLNFHFCIFLCLQSSDDSSLLDLEMLPSTADSSIHAANEVAARLRVDIRTGLTWAEAKYRAKIIGHNELLGDEDDPPWKKYLEQFQNPLILLLLGK